jgi:hypothetical protein
MKVNRKTPFKVQVLDKSVHINMDEGCGGCDQDKAKHLSTRKLEDGYVSEFKCGHCGEVFRLGEHHHEEE